MFKRRISSFLYARIMEVSCVLLGVLTCVEKSAAPGIYLWTVRLCEVELISEKRRAITECNIMDEWWRSFM